MNIDINNIYIGSLEWVYFRAHRIVGWLDGLRDAGLDQESFDALERLDSDLNSKAQKKIYSDFQDSTRKRVTELRREIEAESPDWARSRRMEYLNSRRQDLIRQIVSRRIAAGKLIKKVPNDGPLMAEIFMPVDSLEVEVKKIDNEIKFRWAPKPQGRISDHDIDRAKEFPLHRLLEKKPGEKVVCLWHTDKNPSFHLYASGKGHCFVCGVTRDAIDWVMESRGVGFIDAVKALL